LKYWAELEILNRLLEATRVGDIVWSEEDEGQFNATVGGRGIYFRFLYYEATNQDGADPRMFEFGMPGLNGGYHCGTEGWSILMEILESAFEKRRPSGDPDGAMKFLDRALPARRSGSETIASDQTSREKVPLILASASPRRRELLTEAGYRFQVAASDIDEPEPAPGVPVADYVANLAWRKASSVAASRGVGLILGADTACAVGGEILNKPVDRADAERMIRLQEGREIEVVTGLCLYRAGRGEWVGAVDVTVCHCRVLTDAERAEHLDSGRWEGKAGAYGVQDDDPFVTVIRGSWSNVVGLPLERLAALLASYPSLTI